VTIRKKRNSLKRGLTVLMLSALLCGAVAPMAGAQTTSPSCDQYSSQNCVIPNHGGGGSGSGGLSGRIGSLPFTGFDVLAMAAVALAVTGLGLVLQRAVSKPREEL
jgi:hypothetical protein